jgi:hypothetical protein
MTPETKNYFLILDIIKIICHIGNKLGEYNTGTFAWISKGKESSRFSTKQKSD